MTFTVQPWDQSCVVYLEILTNQKEKEKGEEESVWHSVYSIRYCLRGEEESVWHSVYSIRYCLRGE